MASTIWKFGILAASASQALASCAYGTLLHPRGAEGHVEVSHFGYTASNGPANWQNLDPKANAMCNTGTHQSPINMITGNFSVIPAAELDLDIPDIEEGEFENLGTTCEIVGGKGTMSFQNVTYTFKQFHFHLPSEHLDNGVSMAMEMHAVWQSEEGKIAVIGTFIDLEVAYTEATESEEEDECDESCSNVKPKSTLRMGRRTAAKAKSSRREITKRESKDRRELPSTGGSFFHVNTPGTAGVTHSDLLELVLGCINKIAKPGTTTVTEPLRMSEVVDVWNKGTFQTYEGSLTTPPCKEGVRWLVSDQKFSISTNTFLKARSVIGFNSRFPQNTLGEPNVLALGH